MQKKRVTDEQIIEAAQSIGGTIIDIADFLNVDRSTIRRRRDKDESGAISAAIAEAKEGTTDIAESNIVNAIKAGDINASKYWLSTIGKNRGFTTQTKTEVSGHIDRKVHVQIVRLPRNGRETPGYDDD